MSAFWSFWIIALTVICLVLVLWVLLANRKVAVKDDGSDESTQTTGHIYDGIEEYDNPLPKWWFQMFIWSIIWGVGYLIWYPGMGAWKGLGGWTSTGQLEQQMAVAQKGYDETYAPFMEESLEDLAHNNQALDIGFRLFLDNCAICHGADGGGNFSIPDLTDNDWIHGGKAEAILETIANGRKGSMPAWGKVIGSEATNQVTEYVLKMSQQEHDKPLADKGAKVFQQYCAACHGTDGTGLIAMGAPNLTDDIWLYGGSRDGVLSTIAFGQNGEMPAQSGMLRKEKIYVLAAYVYSLSHMEE